MQDRGCISSGTPGNGGGEAAPSCVTARGIPQSPHAAKGEAGTARAPVSPAGAACRLPVTFLIVLRASLFLRDRPQLPPSARSARRIRASFCPRGGDAGEALSDLQGVLSERTPSGDKAEMSPSQSRPGGSPARPLRATRGGRKAKPGHRSRYQTRERGHALPRNFAAS